MVEDKILVNTQEIQDMYDDIQSEQLDEEELITIHNNFIALASIIGEQLGHKIDSPHYIALQQHTVH